MPPPVSDDESGMDIPDEIPAKLAADKPTTTGDDGDDDDEDDEEDEEEFNVERVTDHRFVRGKIQYHIKWLGYDDETDKTWEPPDNLENSWALVQTYHDSIGGTPQPPAKGSSSKLKASKSMDGLSSPAPSASKKRARKSDSNGTAKFVPPVGSWEDHISHIAAIVEGSEPSSTGSKKLKMEVNNLAGLVEWSDGHKTQHSMKELRRQCPQRLLDYYENHLLKPRMEEMADLDDE